MAMGVAPEIARGAVRVSLGRGTTAPEVEGFLAAVAEMATQLKLMTALSV